MNAKKSLFASCFGCVSGVKYADEKFAAADDGTVKAKKRRSSRVKKNQAMNDPALGMDKSKPYLEPPAHDTLSSSLGAERTEKGNESPSSHFRNTPSVASVSETEDVLKEDNKPTIQSPPPLVLDPVIIPSDEKKKESVRAVYLEGRQNKSDVTNDISAELRTETSSRRRMSTERENRLSCHPVILRTKSFLSSSSSGEDEVDEEECASDFE